MNTGIKKNESVNSIDLQGFVLHGLSKYCKLPKLFSNNLVTFP